MLEGCFHTYISGYVFHLFPEVCSRFPVNHRWHILFSKVFFRAFCEFNLWRIYGNYTTAEEIGFFCLLVPGTYPCNNTKNTYASVENAFYLKHIPLEYLIVFGIIVLS